MAFRKEKQYLKRSFYSRSGMDVINFPKGNLISEFHLAINLLVTIATSAASNAPDFQVARVIKKLELIRGTNDVQWSLSGEGLAAKFLNRRGAQAASNASIAGTVAANVNGKMYLKCMISPEDAARPQDYLMDTRAWDYRLEITYADLGAVGTLFATIPGTVTPDTANSYIDVSYVRLPLAPSVDGTPDSLQNAVPLMRALKETVFDVVSSATDFKVTLPDTESYRGVLLWATHETVAGQVQGNNGVLTNNIALADSQGKNIHTYKAADLREESSLDWGLGSAMPNGVYDLALTPFGNITDDIMSTSTATLALISDVTKLTNTTKVRAIYDITRRQ